MADTDLNNKILTKAHLAYALLGTIGAGFFGAGISYNQINADIAAVQQAHLADLKALRNEYALESAHYKAELTKINAQLSAQSVKIGNNSANISVIQARIDY